MHITLVQQEATRTQKKRRSTPQFPASRLNTKCHVLDWLPLIRVWVQYLKFSAPHDQPSVQTGPRNGSGNKYSQNAASLHEYSVQALNWAGLCPLLVDQRKPTLLLSVTDINPVGMCTCQQLVNQPICQSVLTGQAPTISSMMTTVIALLGLKFVADGSLGRAAPLPLSIPPLACFPRRLAKKRSRLIMSVATGGFPSGLSGLSSVRGVPQHAGHCNTVADRSPAPFPLAARCLPPGRSRSACTARAQPPGNEGVL